MNKKSRIFWFVYIFFILFFSFSVFKNVFFQFSLTKQINSFLFISNLLQRLSGSVALFLLFVQIIFGAYRPKLSKLLGNWVMNFHIWQGRVIYVLVLIHTFSLLLFNFISKKGFDPFYVFVDFCVLCQTRKELFYSFGRFGFWLLNLAILSALVRKDNWWRQNWRYFHILNYILFFLISLHAFFIGSDFSLRVGYLGKLNLIFSIFVFAIILHKVLKWFLGSFRFR